MNRCRILVVDDEPDICALIKDVLEDEGFAVSTAQNARDADLQFTARRPDLVLLDIWMPGEDGISLLKSWQGRSRDRVPVIIMSGHGTVETAVEATRLGAHKFIEKPVTTAKLLQSVRGALAGLDADAGAVRVVLEPVGLSPGVQALRERAAQLAASDEHVAIVGEPGVGKTTLGEYIHSLSARAGAPCVVVHAARLDEQSLAAALTGAAGGVLLVRQINAPAPSQQQTLGKALAGERLASENIRLVTTSLSKPGDFMKAAGVTQTVVEIAPLRKHAEDVPELVKSCTDYWCQSRQLPYRCFSIAAQNRLLHYNWPGNLGELSALVRTLLESGRSSEISLEEVEEQLRGRESGGAWVEQAMDKPMREAREMFERFYLARQLELTEGNVSRLAEKVGMERTHLYRKLRMLGISLKNNGKHP